MRRQVLARPDDAHGLPARADTVLELAHGCLACTLREDLLPLLRRLARRSGVERIVLDLDPALEPESVCWAVDNVVLDDGVREDTAGAHVTVEAVLAVLDAERWLADVTGSDDLVQRGYGAGEDDQRTVASVAAGQVEFADLIVLAGDAPGAWAQLQTAAVLDRLAPGVPRLRDDRGLDPIGLLAAVPTRSRRGTVDDPLGPVLRGQPPERADCGISLTLFTARRPFHPARLRSALVRLVGEVVRTRGVAWTADRPDLALRLETAGGGASMGQVGPWLAAAGDGWDEAEPERRAMAALDWDPYFGDRRQEIAVVSHDLPAEQVHACLAQALLSDDELAAGEQAWHSP